VVLAKLPNRDVIANVNPLASSLALVLIPKDAIISFLSRPPSRPQTLGQPMLIRTQICTPSTIP
jgi:hypothetical protein